MKETDLKLLTLAKELFDKDKQFPLCYRSYVLSMEYYQGKQEGLSAGQKGYLEKLLSFLLKQLQPLSLSYRAKAGKSREEALPSLVQKSLNRHGRVEIFLPR